MLAEQMDPSHCAPVGSFSTPSFPVCIVDVGRTVHAKPQLNLFLFDKTAPIFIYKRSVALEGMTYL
jgi:hypothetical protein